MAEVMEMWDPSRVAWPWLPGQGEGGAVGQKQERASQAWSGRVVMLSSGLRTWKY